MDVMDARRGCSCGAADVTGLSVGLPQGAVRLGVSEDPAVRAPRGIRESAYQRPAPEEAMWDQVGRLYAYHGDVPVEVRLLVRDRPGGHRHRGGDRPAARPGSGHLRGLAEGSSRCAGDLPRPGRRLCQLSGIASDGRRLPGLAVLRAVRMSSAERHVRPVWPVVIASRARWMHDPGLKWLPF